MKMSPIDELKFAIEKKFPEAEILIRKADDPKGFQFLNIYLEDVEISVEWKPNSSDFGLSQWLGDKTVQIYCRPTEFYKSVVALYHRICSVLVNDTKAGLKAEHNQINNRLIEAMEEMLNFPLSQICVHSVALRLLSILNENSNIGNLDELSEAIIQCDNERALNLIKEIKL